MGRQESRGSQGASEDRTHANEPVNRLPWEVASSPAPWPAPEFSLRIHDTGAGADGRPYLEGNPRWWRMRDPLGQQIVLAVYTPEEWEQLSEGVRARTCLDKTGGLYLLLANG